MVYKIVSGNDDKRLELVKQNGVWALHFRRRLKSPEVFDLVIHGTSIKNSQSEMENSTYEKSLILRIKLVVIE